MSFAVTNTESLKLRLDNFYSSLNNSNTVLVGTVPKNLGTNLWAASTQSKFQPSENTNADRKVV